MAQWLQDRWFLRIVLVGLVVRATLAALVPPGFDEAYYGVFAFHPAWGYFDHPPAVAVTAGIGMWLTGVVTAYTLRIGALLLFLGTSLVLYRLVLEMVNRPAALWSVFLLHVTPYFFYGMGAFVIPDNALGFFWLLTLYFMWKVYQTQNPRWFLAVGASTGLALLAKYHAVLLIGSIGYVLLFYRGWRKYLKTPYPYLGLILAVLIFLPNILWNAAHQWISYRYQFGKGGGGHLSLTLFYQGILVQLGYLLPWIAYWLLKSTVDIWRTRQRQYLWLLPFILFPIGIFTAIGATRPILPHWPMPGYLGAFVLVGMLIYRWEPVTRKRIAYGSVALILFLGALVGVQAVTGILPLDLKADVTLDGQGWEQAVAAVTARPDFDPEQAFLFTHKWFTGGEVAFADGNRHVVTVFNPKDPGNFPYWVDHTMLVGKTGFFIDTNRYPAPVEELFGQYFTHIQAVDTVRTRRLWGKGQQFIIWKCEGYTGNFPLPYGGRRP